MSFRSFQPPSPVNGASHSAAPQRTVAQAARITATAIPCLGRCGGKVRPARLTRSVFQLTGGTGSRPTLRRSAIWRVRRPVSRPKLILEGLPPEGSGLACEQIGPGGFEPPLTDPKSAVLPLDEGPASAAKLQPLTPLRQARSRIV